MKSSFRKLRAALDAARAELDAERQADARGLILAIPAGDEAAAGREPGTYGSQVIFADEDDLNAQLSEIPAPDYGRLVIRYGPRHIDPPTDLPRPL